MNERTNKTNESKVKKKNALFALFAHFHLSLTRTNKLIHSACLRFVSSCFHENEQRFAIIPPLHHRRFLLLLLLYSSHLLHCCLYFHFPFVQMFRIVYSASFIFPTRKYFYNTEDFFFFLVYWFFLSQFMVPK